MASRIILGTAYGCRTSLAKDVRFPASHANPVSLFLAKTAATPENALEIFRDARIVLAPKPPANLQH